MQARQAFETALEASRQTLLNKIEEGAAKDCLETLVLFERTLRVGNVTSLFHLLGLG